MRILSFALVAMAGLTFRAGADSLSLLDQLTDSVGGPAGVSVLPARRDPPEFFPQRNAAVTAFGPTEETHRPAGVLATFRRIGLGFEAVAGDEKSGGIAWSPTDRISIGAGAQLDGGEPRIFFRLRF